VIRTAIWLSIGIVALAIVWIALGRHIALLLDGLVTSPPTCLPTEPLLYDGGGFVIGGKSMTFAGINNLPGAVTLSSDSSGRVVITADHNAFVAGPLTATSPSGHPDFYFKPEAGDEVSFTVKKSLLPWPTPFEFKMLGGASPWWRQYVYYRLTWNKPSGAQLEMLWRYERQYYSDKGWTEPEMMWNSQTGLLTATIRESK
jgi:hypothetical protein